MDFLERAKFTIGIGAPVIRLLPRAKIPLDTDWPSLATKDIQIIEKWNQETPEANCGAVAKAELGGVCVFELDSPLVPERIYADTNKKLSDIDTFKVRSSVGRGHLYFFHSDLSLKTGNIGQSFVKEGDWSFRADKQFVVSAHSLHPRTGLPYEIRSQSPIATAPPWLIEWCQSQRVEKKEALVDDDEIIEGGRNVRLTSLAGKLRYAGLSQAAIEAALIETNRDRCVPPLDEQEVRVIAHSVARYKVGQDNTVLHGGVVAGTTPDVQARPAITVREPEEAETIEAVPYPKFPDWVMKGTSIYENLVRPFCDVNSRYEAFMWLPSMVILLNYLGGKCRIEHKNINPSLFMVAIGRRGKVIKSSSVESAIEYFQYAGILGHDEQSIKNAEGRALVVTPSSPEGLGKEMQRTNCKNIIMYFDELKTLVDKSSIESSTMGNALLQLYEGAKFQSLIKSNKDSFSILPGSYTASLIACSTDKNFTSNWSKLAGKSTGLSDRFMLLLQPEVLKPLTPYYHVNTQEGAIKTRQLIDKAIQQGVYRITDSSPLSKFTAENDDSNRAEIRAEKFALGLAVDMGLDECDEETIERGLAIVAYEQAVKRYLKTYEAHTREGSVQQELMYQLRKTGGHMHLRDLQRVMNATRYGTSLWSQAYKGLIIAGWIREEGTGVKGDPKIVILLRVPEDDED